MKFITFGELENSVRLLVHEITTPLGEVFDFVVSKRWSPDRQQEGENSVLVHAL